jgi:hypothetical protein
VTPLTRCRGGKALLLSLCPKKYELSFRSAARGIPWFQQEIVT